MSIDWGSGIKEWISSDSEAAPVCLTWAELYLSLNEILQVVGFSMAAVSGLFLIWSL